MDDIMARTGMSLGAASQGLKLLREFGAVRTVYTPGARKDHYVASGELSRFATSYIEEELPPAHAHRAGAHPAHGRVAGRAAARRAP